METVKTLSRIIISALAVVMCINLVARSSLRTITRYSDFNERLSAENPLTIVMAYTEPKGLEREQRKAIDHAQSGFRNVSRTDDYEKIKTKFVQVNLDKVPTIADEHGLDKDPGQAHILLFKRGQFVTKKVIHLSDDDDTKNMLHRTAQQLIEENFGDYIRDKIEEQEEYEKELRLQRAAAPRVYSDPLWDYWYHGYYPYRYPYYSYPYYRRNPGFGFYINVGN